MSAPEGRVAQMLLQYRSSLGGLRRVLVLSTWARASHIVADPR